MNKQINMRLPRYTHAQIDELTRKFQLTKTQVLILAVDEFANNLLGDAIAKQIAAKMATERTRKSD